MSTGKKKAAACLLSGLLALGMLFPASASAAEVESKTPASSASAESEQEAESEELRADSTEPGADSEELEADSAEPESGEHSLTFYMADDGRAVLSDQEGSVVLTRTDGVLETDGSRGEVRDDGAFVMTEPAEYAVTVTLLPGDDRVPRLYEVLDENGTETAEEQTEEKKSVLMRLLDHIRDFFGEDEQDSAGSIRLEEIESENGMSVLPMDEDRVICACFQSGEEDAETSAIQEVSSARQKAPAAERKISAAQKAAPTEETTAESAEQNSSPAEQSSVAAEQSSSSTEQSSSSIGQSSSSAEQSSASAEQASASGSTAGKSSAQSENKTTIRIDLTFGGELHVLFGENEYTYSKDTVGTTHVGNNKNVNVLADGTFDVEVPLDEDVTLSIEPREDFGGAMYQTDHGSWEERIPADAADKSYSFRAKGGEAFFINFTSPEEFQFDTTSMQNGEDEPKKLNHDEKVYSKVPFDLEYSAGRLCINSISTPQLVRTGVNENSVPIYSYAYQFNADQKGDIYVDCPNGANINGTFLDVRIYFSIETKEKSIGWKFTQSGRMGQMHTESPEKGTIPSRTKMEFHFYPSGTLGNKSEEEIKACETEFRGVLCIIDLDKGEGFHFVRGLQGVWLNEVTHVQGYDDNTWLGTWTNGQSGGTVNMSTPERETLWAEVRGTPSEPLTLEYIMQDSRASELNYFGPSIHYVLVPHGEDALPEGAATPQDAKCVRYGSYQLAEAYQYDGYVFDGWYEDKALTKEVSSDQTYKVNSDLTFFGTYIPRWRIDVTVINGSISGPADLDRTKADQKDEEVPGVEVSSSEAGCIEGLETGSDRTISYAPLEGYVTDSVTVDGKKLEEEAFSSSLKSYSFSEISANHSILVVCVPAASRLSLSKKVTDEAGNDLDGHTVHKGDTLVYTLTYKNSARVAQNLTITDEIPEHAGYIPESADHGGTYRDGTLTWELGEVEAGGEGTVSFQVKAGESEDPEDKTGGKQTIENTGVLSSSKGSVPSNTVVNDIIDPVKSVANASGEDFDGKSAGIGQKLTYTVAFKNHSDREKTYTVKDVLPSIVKFDSFPKGSEGGETSTSGSVADGISTAVIWKNVRVPAGGEFRRSFTVQVVGQGKAVNRAEVVAEGEGTDGGGSAPFETNEVINEVRKVQIRKTAADSEGDGNKALAGAGFLLKNDRGEYYRYTEDGVSWGSLESATLAETDQDGVAVFSGMDAGTYTLVEEKAPEGYLAAEDQTIVIGDGEESYLKEIPIEDKKSGALPATGSSAMPVLFAVWIPAAVLSLILRKKG